MGPLGLDLLEGDLDSLEELLVCSCIFLDRIVVENNVRIDTIVLDDPLSGVGEP